MANAQMNYLKNNNSVVVIASGDFSSGWLNENVEKRLEF
jgi:hypothetical protein